MPILVCIVSYLILWELWSLQSPFDSKSDSNAASPATWTECDSPLLSTPADCQLGAKSINNFLSSVHQKNCLLYTKVPGFIFWQETLILTYHQSRWEETEKRQEKSPKNSLKFQNNSLSIFPYTVDIDRISTHVSVLVLPSRHCNVLLFVNIPSS